MNIFEKSGGRQPPYWCQPYLPGSLPTGASPTYRAVRVKAASLLVPALLTGQWDSLHTSASPTYRAVE